MWRCEKKQEWEQKWCLLLTNTVPIRVRKIQQLVSTPIFGKHPQTRMMCALPFIRIRLKWFETFHFTHATSIEFDYLLRWLHWNGDIWSHYLCHINFEFWLNQGGKQFQQQQRKEEKKHDTKAFVVLQIKITTKWLFNTLRGQRCNKRQHIWPVHVIYDYAKRTIVWVSTEPNVLNIALYLSARERMKGVKVWL